MAKNDMFADIAAMGIGNQQKNLIIPQPEKLEEKYLPLSENAGESFKPTDKMCTREELYLEVERQKEYYRPFFEDYAPECKNTRKTMELVSFQWRIGTDEDAKNFNGVLKGEGEWENIKIPHFGEPRGLATTYYRTTFALDAPDFSFGSLWIRFKAVDYKAHVFMNDMYLGSHEGMFAPFEFDFTKQAHCGENTILIMVENDYTILANCSEIGGKHYDGDKIYAATGLGYDDPLEGWHHCPAGMGIYQQVFVEARSDLFVKSIFVRPLLDLNQAEVWVEVHSCIIEQQKIVLDISIYGQNFKQTVIEHMHYHPTTSLTVGLGDSLTAAKSIEDGTLGNDIPIFLGRGVNYFKISVKMPDCRIWELDNPWLYQAQISIIDEKGNCTDTSKQHFGMRSFKMLEDGTPKGEFRLNDKKIRLRGANTMGHEQQCVLKKDWEQLYTDLILAKVCNMNFLRLTQRPVQPEIYDYCDKIGLMIQTDLPLFGTLRRNQFIQALSQSQEMEQLIRSHPCCIIISYINEPFPNAQNRPHRSLVRTELEDFFTCADLAVRIINPDRVIKHIDGDYDPPTEGFPDNHCYPCWYNGHGIDIGRLHKGYWMAVKDNWYYGCGEYGIEGLEISEVMRKYYPADWIEEKADGSWNPSGIIGAQTANFHHFFYETPLTMENWVEASQEYQAFAVSLMTQAYRRDNRMNTFAYHLFIDAFPSGWMKTIMDVDRNPKKSYFAYRDCLTPVMANLRTDRFTAFADETINVEAYICNDTGEIYQDAMLHYQIECDSTVLSSGKTNATMKACETVFQGYIPVKIPNIKSRTDIVIRMAIILKDKILHDTHTTITAFPQPSIAKKIIHFVGSITPEREIFAQDMNIKSVSIENINENSTIIVQDFDRYKKNESTYLNYVQQGTQLVFLNLPKGTYQIANSDVVVKKCGMLPLHFVSRDTNHEIIEGLQANDVRYWYDADVGYITPLLDCTFTAPDFTDILTSGNKNDDGSWSKVSAVAEKEYGCGKIRICELKLLNRTVYNPVAKLVAERLLLSKSL